jgi:BirA family transcriptional regulator, biotin operon repressor / biotin---[acetyl-CoA-carboxylase] ligase
MGLAEAPSFPPLLRGEELPPGSDVFARGVSAALSGTDPGLVLYCNEPHRLQMAVVFAPEMPLEDAMGAVFVAGIGFSDALGALSPPEVGVHFDWPLDFRIDGGRCGGVRAAASTSDPREEPDGLVIAIDIPMRPPVGLDTGLTPDQTWLVEEGCGEVEPVRLVESWSRHMLVWLNRWLDDGLAPLHAEWRAKAFALGDEVTVTIEGVPRSGTFTGLDEKGGMLLREGERTVLFPLTKMLQDA